MVAFPDPQNSKLKVIPRGVAKGIYNRRNLSAEMLKLNFEIWGVGGGGSD